jgi:hypothetical protein
VDTPPPADANGFALPPEMGQGKPPARKPAAKKPKNNEAPPSTEEKQ